VPLRVRARRVHVVGIHRRRARREAVGEAHPRAPRRSERRPGGRHSRRAAGVPPPAACDSLRRDCCSCVEKGGPDEPVGLRFCSLHSAPDCGRRNSSREGLAWHDTSVLFLLKRFPEKKSWSFYNDRLTATLLYARTGAASLFEKNTAGWFVPREKYYWPVAETNRAIICSNVFLTQNSKFHHITEKITVEQQTTQVISYTHRYILELQLSKSM
jgi:hypothetical protein